MICLESRHDQTGTSPCLKVRRQNDLNTSLSFHSRKSHQRIAFAEATSCKSHTTEQADTDASFLLPISLRKKEKPSLPQRVKRIKTYKDLLARGVCSRYGY